MKIVLLAAPSHFVASLLSLCKACFENGEGLAAKATSNASEQGRLTIAAAGVDGSVYSSVVNDCCVVVADNKDLDAIGALTAKNKAIRLVVLSLGAADHIAHAIEGDVPLDTAANDWSDGARKLTAMFRMLQPRISIANAYQALANPNTLLRLSELQASVPVSYQAPPRANAISIRLAGDFVAQNAELVELVEEINASLKLLDDGTSEELPVADLVDGWIANRERLHAFRARFEQLGERIPDVETNGHELMQAKLENGIPPLLHEAEGQGYANNGALQISVLCAQLKAARYAAMIAEQRVAKLEKEAELLWAQLCENQEILERWMSLFNANTTRMSREAPARHGLTIDVALENPAASLSAVLL